MDKNKNLVPSDLFSSKKFKMHLHVKNPDSSLALLLKGLKAEFKEEAIPISILQNDVKLVVAEVDRDMDLLGLIIENYDTVLTKEGIDYPIDSIFKLLEVF